MDLSVENYWNFSDNNLDWTKTDVKENGICNTKQQI